MRSKVDLDDTVRQTYGYGKQGAGRGYTGVNGLNALPATICTPLSAPVIAATRLRKGSTNPVRGAAKLLADALATARRAGVGGLVIVRADSAYYGHDIIAAARRGGARFSVTARQTPAVITAIAGIGGQAWTRSTTRTRSSTPTDSGGSPTPRSPRVAFTAFTGRRQAEHVTARLIVRRVRRRHQWKAGQTGRPSTPRSPHHQQTDQSHQAARRAVDPG
jgi:hypothetical protein